MIGFSCFSQTQSDSLAGFDEQHELDHIMAHDIDNSHNNYNNLINNSNYIVTDLRDENKSYIDNNLYSLESVTSFISSQVNTGCKLDIVLAFDVSGSNSVVTCAASNTFVTSFLTALDYQMDGSLTGVTGANNVQVGLCTWSTLNASLCNNGGQGINSIVSPMSTNSAFLNSFATGSTSNEIIGVNVTGSDFYYAAIEYGMQTLNDFSGSSLGDRSGQANYKRILIIATDASSGDACTNSTSGGPCAIDMQNDVWDFNVQSIGIVVNNGVPPFNWQAITECLVQDPDDQYEGNGITLGQVGVDIASAVCIPLALNENHCFNDSMSFSLNQTVNSVIWDFGDSITGVDNFSNDLEPFHIFSDTGTFFVTAYLVDVSGILDTIIDTVAIYANPVLTSVFNNISCNGYSDGSIDISLNGSQSYDYLWSNGELTEDINMLFSANYSVIVTDTNGCSVYDTILLTEPTPLQTSITPTNFNGYNISCNGYSDGGIDLNVSGSVPGYNYLWNTSDLTEDISNLSIGTYSVDITDINSCSTSTSITLTEPTPLQTSITPTTSFNGYNISCNGYSDGGIDLGVSGSVPGYTYIWDNNEVTQDIINASSGTNNVTITDDNSCTTTTSFTLTEPTPLQTLIIPTDYNGYNISCNGYSDGGIDLVVSGSVPAYSYLWNTLETTQDISSLSLGTYSVDITDLNSCTTSTSFILTEPILLELTSNFAHDTCDRKVGVAEVIVSGGVLAYNYLWSNNQITPVINNLYGGNYSVIITDANNCAISEQFYIDPDLIENPIAEFNVIPDLKMHYLYRQLNNPIFFIDKSIDEFTIITNWFWEFGDGFTSNDQDTKHSFSEIGDFNVTLAIENLYGCLDTITKRVIIEEFLLYIPNSFTPQYDGINDVFLPKGIGVKNYELKIYNRWGEHFFTSDNLNIGWNGRTDRKDKIAQTGVYVYLINVTDVFGEKHTYNGQVTLIK